MIGETIGSYTILSEIGAGGMGSVYLAEHRRLGRKAAIKVLLSDLAKRKDLLERFFSEARATSVIDHPGIVQILDCEIDPQGRPYIVMELIPGDTIGAYLARGRPDVARTAAIARRVAQALGAAHDKGIIHRDIKPDNIFVVSEDPAAIKVVDFGIAKLSADFAGVKANRTQTGVMMGTPLYMSPEQCRGAGSVDYRTDIYSLGCIVFEMLCGRPPFVYEGVGELVAAHLTEQAPHARTFNSDVPGALDALVDRMLRKSTDERPKTMSDVAEALASIAGSATRPGTEAARRGPAPITASHFPTTLGETATELLAAETAPPAPRTRAVIVWMTAALVVGAALVVLWSKFRFADAPPTISSSAPAAIAASAVPSAPRSAPRQVPASKIASALRTASHRAAGKKLVVASSPAAPPLRTVRITIDSDPAGAEVCLASDRRRLGQTSTDVHVPGDGKRVTFFVRIPGYRLEEVRVRADKDQRQLVRLQPLGADDLEPASPCR